MEHCWESFRLLLLLQLPLLLLLQFSCTRRKEMSKNDKVNGCAQNTTHTRSHSPRCPQSRHQYAAPSSSPAQGLPIALAQDQDQDMCAESTKFYMHLIYVSPAPPVRSASRNFCHALPPLSLGQLPWWDRPHAPARPCAAGK